MVPAVAALLVIAVASKASGLHGVLEDEAIGNENCTSPSVSMLQRGVASLNRRGGNDPAETMLQKELQTEDSELRRKDAKLRAYNFELRRRLENMTSFLAVRMADAQRKHRRWQDILRPVPMAILAIGFSSIFYWTVYFYRLYAFNAKRSQIDRENRGKRYGVTPIPSYADIKEEMEAEFFFSLSQWSVRSMLILFVLAVTGASYLASRGYFAAVVDKIVPLAYVIFVGMLFLMVLCKEAKRAFDKSFGPMGQALGQLVDFTEDLGTDPVKAVRSLLLQQTADSLHVGAARAAGLH